MSKSHDIWQQRDLAIRRCEVVKPPHATLLQPTSQTQLPPVTTGTFLSATQATLLVQVAFIFLSSFVLTWHTFFLFLNSQSIWWRSEFKMRCNLVRGEFGFYAADHSGENESRKKAEIVDMTGLWVASTIQVGQKSPCLLQSIYRVVSVNLCDRSYNGGLGNFVNIFTYCYS